ncbi:MAG TPA: heme exporter protein CcmB [Rudaea sp.]|jgi:heme exporter protein B|nr:heme exporter protein CcmB [Rudaea sp.]
MKPGSTSAACVALLRRDLLLVWRRRGDALNPLLFAIIVVALFPFALGPEAAVLSRIAAGTIFVAVLLAMLLSLDALFRSDLEDGSLEQLVLSPHPLALLLGCKILVHWLTTALPLIVIAPLLAQLLLLPAAVLPVLLTALALATPLLSLIGAVCVALTVGMRRSGMLLTLLVLPLIVPALIFGAGACNAAQNGFAYSAPLLWLAAWLVLAVILAPLAAAAALKISLT